MLCQQHLGMDFDEVDDRYLSRAIIVGWLISVSVRQCALYFIESNFVHLCVHTLYMYMTSCPLLRVFVSENVLCIPT